MTDLLDDALLPNDRAGLEAQIEEIEVRLRSAREDIRSLMAAEDPAAGVWFPEDIHQAKQRVMLLNYQKDIRAVRLNALKNAEQ